ncbi:hypothetical protein D0T87_23680 [Bacteroides sp. 51]|nr:hypothetical protein [Bacteroides sp. 51]
MALRVGSVGLRLEARGPGPDWRRPALGWVEVGPGRDCWWMGPAMAARSIRQAMNNRLRTGSD